MMRFNRCLLFLGILLVLGTLSETATDKKEEKTSTLAPPKEQSAANMFVDFSKLEVVDLLRSGAILVAFIFAFLGDKKGETRVWQLAESIFLGLHGLAYIFFPSLLMEYFIVGKTDIFHVYLVQSIGLSLVGLAVVSHRQYHANSKDSQVAGGWLLSRVVGFTFLHVNGIYTKVSLANESQRLSDQFVMTAGLAYGLFWMGSLVKLWQHIGSENGGGRSSSRGKPASIFNQHLLIGIMMILPEVIMDFGMPKFAAEIYMDQKCDAVHLHMIRAVGSIGLVALFQQITAFQYENDGDKRDFFIGQIVILVFVFPLMFLYQYKHALFTAKVFGFGLVFTFAYLGNSVCAAFIRGKDKKY